MTPGQVCAVLGISREDFGALVVAGQLPVVGGRSGIRVSDAGIEEYISRSLPDHLVAAS